VARRHVLFHAGAGAGIRPAGIEHAYENILLVEDNPDDAELAVRAFDRAAPGRRFRSSADGVEAVEALFGSATLASAATVTGPGAPRSQACLDSMGSTY
jgi:CheY-like chemotaxis protein